MNVTEAQDLALNLMKKHGLVERGWQFKFDRAKTRCGICSYGKKTIRLSRHFVELNAEVLVIDTILHEIAHALVGTKVGHGYAWKLKAVEIGAKPERCKAGIVSAKGTWRVYCPNCGITAERYRKPRTKVGRTACAACCRKYANGKFDPRFLIIREIEDGSMHGNKDTSTTIQRP